MIQPPPWHSTRLLSEPHRHTILLLVTSQPRHFWEPGSAAAEAGQQHPTSVRGCQAAPTARHSLGCNTRSISRQRTLKTTAQAPASPGLCPSAGQSSGEQPHTLSPPPASEGLQGLRRFVTGIVCNRQQQLLPEEQHNHTAHQPHLMKQLCSLQRQLQHL